MDVLVYIFTVSIPDVLKKGLSMLLSGGFLRVINLGTLLPRLKVLQKEQSQFIDLKANKKVVDDLISLMGLSFIFGIFSMFVTLFIGLNVIAAIFALFFSIFLAFIPVLFNLIILGLIHWFLTSKPLINRQVFVVLSLLVLLSVIFSLLSIPGLLTDSFSNIFNVIYLFLELFSIYISLLQLDIMLSVTFNKKTNVEEESIDIY